MNSLYFSVGWMVDLQEWPLVRKLFDFAAELSCELVIVPDHNLSDSYTIDSLIIKAPHQEAFDSFKQRCNIALQEWSKASENDFSNYFAFDARTLRPYELKTWLTSLRLASQQNTLHKQRGLYIYQPRRVRAFEPLWDVAPLDALELSDAALNALKRMGLTSVGDIVDRLDHPAGVMGLKNHLDKEVLTEVIQQLERKEYWPIEGEPDARSNN